MGVTLDTGSAVDVDGFEDYTDILDLSNFGETPAWDICPCKVTFCIHVLFCGFF